MLQLPNPSVLTVALSIDMSTNVIIKIYRKSGLPPYSSSDIIPGDGLLVLQVPPRAQDEGGGGGGGRGGD